MAQPVMLVTEPRSEVFELCKYYLEHDSERGNKQTPASLLFAVENVLILVFSIAGD